MKKTFIAAAVGVAMAAPLSAFAAATLYGQAHGSIDFVEDISKENQIAVSSNSSRIGVKGSENVGGMDVIYGMEWHVSLSDNGSSKDLSARNRFVGLKSADFGTILIGRMDTPSKKLGRSVDLFHSTQLGENRNVVAIHGGDARRDNVIQWNSTNMSGFKMAVQYSADALGTIDETKLLAAESVEDVSTLLFKGKGDLTDDNEQDALSISGTYTTGDIMVGVSYDDFASSISVLRLAGSYNMGDIKLVAFYESADLSDVYSDLGLGAIYDDATTLGLGASLKNGANTFKVAYYDMSNAYGLDIDGLDSDGSLLSVGIDHAMSSSVMVYATAAFGDNFVKPAGYGHDDQTAAADTSGVSFGIRKKF